MEVGELTWPFSDVLNGKRAKLAQNPKERALPAKSAESLHQQGTLPTSRLRGASQGTPH